MSARACSKSEGGKGTRQASQSERVKREGRENDPIQRQKTEKQSERDTHTYTHTRLRRAGFRRRAFLHASDPMRLVNRTKPRQTNPSEEQAGTRKATWDGPIDRSIEYS